jgi:type IV pilus assembly protein PilA
VQLLGSGKTPFAEYFADKGAWPAVTDVMGNTQGKYTSSITITGTPVATGTAPSITLQATMKSSGVNSNITSGTVLLATTDGGKNWNCTSGGTTAINAKFLPAACR